MIKRTRQSFQLLLIFVITVTCFTVSAAEKENTTVPPPPEDTIEFLDSTHASIYQNLSQLADSIDRFFGDERIDIESANNRFRLDISTIHREGGNIDYDGRLHAKFELPRTRHRFNIIIESDPEEAFEEDPEKRAQSAPLTDTSETEYSAALRYINEKSKPWNLNTDIGIKLRIPLDPFTRLRVSRTKQLNHWLIRFTETLFWFNSIGLGETTRLDFEQPLSEAFFFRTTSKATWLHDLQGFELNQNFSLFHKINNQFGVAYRTSIIGNTQPDTHVTGYILNIQLRKKIYKDWLFFQITPQAFFPEEENFRLSPSLTLTLEANFAQTPD